MVLETGETQISSMDGMTKLYVPAGEFLMGTDEEYDSWDITPSCTQHLVYLDAFGIDVTEVTNALYANFLTDMGSQYEG